MLEKPSLIDATTSNLALNVNKGETKFMRINSKNNSAIILHGEVLEEVKYFTFLGSVMATNGGTGCVVRAMIGKARAA